MKLRKSWISKKRHFLTCRPPSRLIFENLTKYRKNIEKAKLPFKVLEFRVEFPKGNEIKEIQNFKETTFFDMSSAQPADFRKSDKVSKNPFCSGHHVLFGVRFGDDERFDAVLGVLFGDALLAVVVFVVGVRWTVADGGWTFCFVRGAVRPERAFVFAERCSLPVLIKAPV